MLTTATIEKWLIDRCTVIQPSFTTVSSTKRVTDAETTLATGVKCRFDEGSGGLVETMLGQQRKVQRRLFMIDTPVLKPTFGIIDEATSERYTVVACFQYPNSGHQEATLERAATP